MGVGATNVLARVAASVGELTAVEPVFQKVSDVPNGGVLFALPALLAIGILHQTEKYFRLPKGYYGLESLFLLLAFLALARLPSLEQLRYCAPGEWGKLLGLDRIPEVRTIRRKLALLSAQEPAGWSAELCAHWMGTFPEQASLLYIDGHVRVYHGHQTQLPRHYVARQKLCLRATTDYWVNAMDGQPFFLLNQPVDPGLLQVLEQQIVPRLEETIPHQPSVQELEADPKLHRFTLIFDREGYSPDFFQTMKEKRIACLTYHKYPGENWPQEEFQKCQVKLASGACVEMKLAERGTSFLGGKLWIREIRKLTESSHQIAVLATEYLSESGPIAAAMFARWSQENFFKYMRKHYGLDRLVDYGVDEIPDTIRVVNPEYRRLDGLVRSKNGQLSRKRAVFGAMTLQGDIEPKKVTEFEQKKAELQEEIDALKKELDELKTQRKANKRHITIAELPEKERFKQLSTQSKQLIDTIKMVAYRAETAMTQIVREKMVREDDARSLLRALYDAEVDLIPDERTSTLTICVHHQATRSSDEIIRHLCNELNETETIFPGTSLRLVYKLVLDESKGTF